MTIAFNWQFLTVVLRACLTGISQVCSFSTSGMDFGFAGLSQESLI